LPLAGLKKREKLSQLLKMCGKDDEGKVPQLFPFRRAPESQDKFPFRDLSLYTNPSYQHHFKQQPRTLGYLSQISIQHLESTGRKPDIS